MLISSQLLFWKIDLKFALFILRANSFMSPSKIGAKNGTYSEILSLGQSPRKSLRKTLTPLARVSKKPLLVGSE